MPDDGLTATVMVSTGPVPVAGSTKVSITEAAAKGCVVAPSAAVLLPFASASDTDEPPWPI